MHLKRAQGCKRNHEKDEKRNGRHAKEPNETLRGENIQYPEKETV